MREIKLEITDGSGSCSSCGDEGEITLILTNDDPVGFCDDCKNILVSNLKGALK